MRLAHGWAQADAAAAWNQRWPDDPKTFKNISYWENWPGRTGYAPSLAVLDRLAELYECNVADLLAGWGEHSGKRAEPDAFADAELATIAWQVRNLDLPELTHAVTAWSTELPADERRSLLLKLSTAAAFSAAELSERQTPSTTPMSRLPALAGLWTSRYSYYSTGRDSGLTDQHQVQIRPEDGRLVGRSLPHASGSELEPRLTLEGSVATGEWTERTSPIGYYRAATYRGVLQLVVDPTGRSMTGQWLGVSERFTVKSGRWELTWGGPAPPDATVDR